MVNFSCCSTMEKDKAVNSGDAATQPPCNMTTEYDCEWQSEDLLYLAMDNTLKMFIEFRVAIAIDIYYVLFSSILGIIGNLSAFVTLLSSSLRRSTTCQYMAVIAIMDTLVLVMNVLFMARKFPGHEIFNHWSCKLLLFLFYFTIHFDVAVMLAMTFEKYLAVRFPLHTLSRKPRTKFIIGTIAFCACALNIHNLFTRGMIFDRKAGKEICAATGPSNAHFLQHVWPWIDASVYCFIPLFSQFVLNILIIRWIKKSEKIRKNMGNRRISVRWPPLQSASTNCSGCDTMKKTRRTERQITRMLLLVSFAFLILVGPMGVLIVMERIRNLSASPHMAAVHHLVRTIVNNLMYTNHALNFLLYCFSAKRFRKALIETVCGCWRSTNQARGCAYVDLTQRPTTGAIGLTRISEDE